MLFVRRFLASSAISKPAERSIKISGGLVWTGKWIRRRQQHYSRRYGDYLTGRPVAELSLMPQAGRGRLGLVYAKTERSGRDRNWRRGGCRSRHRSEEGLVGREVVREGGNRWWAEY